jgi:hypothetical protein
MRLNSGNRLKSLCLFFLIMLCGSLYATQVAAQCCCGGVHISVYGEDKKAIDPVVTALVGLKDPAQTMSARLIEPKIDDKGEKTTRVSADCYGFSLMEITIAHKGERMVLRLRDMPFGELGEVVLEPLAFRAGTSEIDFKGKVKENCKDDTNDFGCVIASTRWQKISDQPQAELTPPPAKTESP